MYTLVLLLLISALVFTIYLEVCLNEVYSSNKNDKKCILKSNSIGRKLAETYDGEVYSYVLFVIKAILIVLLIIFLILEFFTVINIINYDTYDGKIAILEEENSKIDENMKTMLITTRPDYIIVAESNDLSLDGKYADLIQTVDDVKDVSGVKDQVERYNDNKKEIRKIKEKKNNISKYKRLIFLFWK